MFVSTADIMYTGTVDCWIQARGEGERVLALESREGTRASIRVEEGLSRFLSGGGGKPSCKKGRHLKTESHAALMLSLALLFS